MMEMPSPRQNTANTTNTIEPSLDGTVNYLGAALRSCYLKSRSALWQRENLAHWRDRHLRWLVKWAYRKSPFYRQLYESAGVKIDSFKIEDLPTANRRMLMANFDQVVTEPGITRQYYTSPANRLTVLIHHSATDRFAGLELK